MADPRPRFDHCTPTQVHHGVADVDLGVTKSVCPLCMTVVDADLLRVGSRGRSVAAHPADIGVWKNSRHDPPHGPNEVR